MKLTFLGTGNAQATKVYNTCLLLEEGEEALLVDAGGGNTILSILEKKDKRLSLIRYLYITHEHIDHLLGCFWIIRRIAEEMNKGNYDGVFTVYGEENLLSDVISFSNKTLTKKICALFGERILFVPLCDRKPFSILGGKLTPFDIKSNKMKQFGFVFEKGDLIFTDCGDEPLSESNFSLAAASTYLTHEAFCLYSDRDIFHPYEKNHSTVKDACENAEKLGVENLILYHTEDRSGIETRKTRYTREAEKYYKGNIFVPDDGDEIILSSR